MIFCWASDSLAQSDARSQSVLSQIEDWYNDMDSEPSEILLKVDSLLVHTEGRLSDLEKAHLFHIKSDCYYYLDDIRASDLAIKKAIELAPENFHTAKLAEMYNSHGQNLEFLGAIDEAILVYNKGLELAIKVKDSIRIGNFYHNIGLSHFALSNFEKALIYIDSSQTVCFLIRDSIGISSVLRIRSTIFSHYDNLERAIETSNEGIRYTTDVDPELRCFHLLDIANIYYKKNELDSIYKYVTLGKNCSEKFGYGSSRIEVYKTLGNYYRVAKDTTNAIVYYDSLVALAERLGDIQGYYHGLISKYTIHVDAEQIAEAIDALKNAEKLGLERLSMVAYYKISDRLYQVGRSDEAYRYLKKSNALQDRYNKEDNRQIMEVQSAKFKLFEKDSQARLAQAKLKTRQAQFITFGILGASLFIALITWIVFKNKKAKFILSEEKLRKETELLKEIAEVESQAFRAQMNPHFIFNALNSIKGLIINKQDKEAAIYISKFSKLVRNVLNNSRNKTILLSDEIATLDMYIKLEQMRFRDGFEYNIHVDDNVEIDSLYIPPVTIQPFVENAIWHGFKKNRRENMLSTQFSLKGEELHIEIVDNGVGRAEISSQKNRQSHGINITRQRILNFSQDQDLDRLKFKDLKDKIGNALGTQVTIRIPIKFKMND